jgi:hypothetical protein
MYKLRSYLNEEFDYELIIDVRDYCCTLKMDAVFPPRNVGKFYHTARRHIANARSIFIYSKLHKDAPHKQIRHAEMSVLFASRSPNVQSLLLPNESYMRGDFISIS